MSKVVIAEKPELARDIARAICGIKSSGKFSLPASGNGYTVCACAGHLLELKEPHEIDPELKKWSLEALPIAIDHWPKKIARGKKDLVDKIKTLLKEADCIIHAGDPDDEGQMIVDEVLDFLNWSGKTYRVYINDNIEKNIIKAFQSLKDNDECRGVGYAAYARQIADMCFGINESRLASIKCNDRLSVGRVQTPMLGLVISRDMAIERHEKREFYDLLADGISESEPVRFTFKPRTDLLGGEKHIFDRGVVEKIIDAGLPRVTAFKTTCKVEKKHPPLPYSLTDLISDMSKRYGMSAKACQEATQTLRDDHKAITYNRTDCQYLKEEHYVSAPAVLSIAMGNIDSKWELDFSIKSRAFNDANVDAHHGIIPQESRVDVSKLTKNERAVYEAIVERYAMQFASPAVYEVSVSTFEVSDGDFVFKNKKLIDAGWLGVFKGKAQGECEGPWLEPGDHELNDIDYSIEVGETEPPKPYTDGTLIADMSCISKYVKDPEIKAILKEKDKDKKKESGGIGTVATRQPILDALKKKGFLEDKGRYVRSTEKARKFFKLLPREIKHPDTTAKWWLIQQEIAQGNQDVNAIQRSVVEVFMSHKDTAYKGADMKPMNQIVGVCPKCGENVLSKAGSFQCSSNSFYKDESGKIVLKEGCGFSISRMIAHKKITDQQVSTLLKVGKSPLIKGMKAKSGNKFDAYLTLSEDCGIVFEFPKK